MSGVRSEDVSQSGEPSGVMGEASSVRDHAIALFEFLREVVQLRSTTVRSIDQYESDGKVLWLAETPRAPGCSCAAWRDEGASTGSTSAWLEVARPVLTEPPSPPEALRPWLKASEISDSRSEYPDLQDTISASCLGDGAEYATDDEGNVRFDQMDGILDVWTDYVESQWQPWALKDSRLRPVYELYNELFSIHQVLQSRGDEFELVVGVSLLQWATGGHDVKRHLLTARAELTFESDRGRIAVRPGPEGVVLKLEQDMLEVAEQPSPDLLAEILERLEQAGSDIWQGEDARAVANMWVNSVDAAGRFIDEDRAQPGSPDHATVSWAPAMILRKRTVRPLLEFYENIVALLGEGYEIPDGVAALVAPGGDASHDEEGKHSAPGGSEPDHVYFPLPANDEQLEILERLEASTGVLVQGPPGTGKSHTIANLIAHLLATGNRVLVTSQTPRALKVLQQKLPPEIADLCVLLVGDDRDGMRDLERSVQGITDRYNHWDPARNRALIMEFEEQLEESRRNEARLRGRLVALREKEIDEYSPLGGRYTGSLAAIARTLRQEQARHGWLVPSESIETDAPPPLSNLEASELLSIKRRLDAGTLAALALPMPELADVLSVDDFEALIEREERLRETAGHEASCVDESLVERLCQASESQVEAIQAAVTAYRKPLRRDAGNGREWVGQALRDLLASRAARWETLRRSSSEALERLTRLGEPAAARQVVGLDEQDLLTVKHHAELLREHLTAGGGLGSFVHRPEPVKKAKYIIDGVKVDGRTATKPEALAQLVEWVDVQTAIARLKSEWQPYSRVPEASVLQQIADFRDMQTELEAVFTLRGLASDAQTAFGAAEVPADVDWADADVIDAVSEAVSIALDRMRLEEVAGESAALAKAIRSCAVNGNAHPLVDDLAESVRSRDIAAYRSAHGALAHNWNLRVENARRLKLMDLLRIQCPTTTSTFEESFAEAIWQERFAAFEAAWAWALADRWLEASLEPGAMRRLSRKLDDAEATSREALSELAAERAWGRCFRRMTDVERMHLVAWVQAVHKIGKGTGKHAPRYRRNARENLEKCRSAIPAWVMPTYRVAEMIRPGHDRFDVVIVDEASQSGLDSLFLHFLADKLIIVGDNKQISPDAVGTSPQAVEDLRRRHLADVPLSAAFRVDSSLFDQAQIRFGNSVRLREHFRCMPEIIEFSNQLQYASEPLVPLRQFGSDRLEPIMVRHVADGYQEGKASSAVNHPEAEALVAAVKACCCDARYDHATMGVISLLGEAQARLIERLLLTSVGPEGMERRRLVCGDAYSFQGDERDVMFLSMVSAPNAKIGALADGRARRRFNVAVSRAKDQLWLFHTATSKDLSPTCVRRALLEYCYNPAWDRLVTDDVSLLDLEKASREAERDEVRPPRPFESWFEVDVFLAIAKRGYRVAPQHSVAGYRIDMVIEGARSRLAVECDGDWSHAGVEKLEADMARQRKLERCGWNFWRVGGGEFYRDPDKALRGLWSTLAHYGILPQGAETEDVAAPPAVVPDKDRLPVLGEAVSTPPADDHEDESAATESDPVAAVEALTDGLELDVDSAREAPGVDKSTEAAAAESGDSEAEPQSSSDSGPITWDQYEAGVGAWAFPELDEQPAQLPQSQTSAVQDAPSATAPIGALGKTWLTHGVLGRLPLRTIPRKGDYKVAEISQVETHGRQLASMPRADLAALVTRVVSVESPVLVDEVARRIARVVGVRVTYPAERAFQNAADYAVSFGDIAREGDVLWSLTDSAPVVRDRSGCPKELKVVKSVPQVEIEWALHRAVLGRPTTAAGACDQGGRNAPRLPACEECLQRAGRDGH
jgi:very-short-patch-repair endonuclease